MKIVHIIDRFYAQAGYLINIIAKYEVREGHEVTIISSDTDFWDAEKKEFWDAAHVRERDSWYEHETGCKIIRYPAYAKIATRVFYKHGLFRYVDSLQPDVLFIHSESSYCSLLYLLRIRKLRFPIVLGSHMMDIAAVSKFRNIFYFLYQRTFAKIIEKNDVLVIRTQDDDYAMRRLGIPEALAPLISFGSDLDIFHPNLDARRAMRAKLMIDENDFVAIVTGKLNKFKGGELLARTFIKKFDERKNVVLITVGTVTDDEYGNMVKQTFDLSENRILRIPTQDYRDLAQYYQCADLSLFARECSLSFYDAQACGLPVVLEDNELNIKRVAYHNGLTFKSGDVENFRTKIRYFIDLPEEQYREYALSAIQMVRENYDYRDISLQYTALLQESANRFREKKGWT